MITESIVCMFEHKICDGKYILAIPSISVSEKEFHVGQKVKVIIENKEE